MENLNIKQRKRVNKEYAARVAALITSYAKLNENGREKADEYLHDILTQIKDYTHDLSKIEGIKDNIIKVNFRNERRC